MATRNGSAEWHGDLKEGSGTLTVGEGVFEGPFSFKSRFEDGEGTNPEEMVAAAHAGCFTMALSLILGNDGHTPDSLRTTAKVTLRNVDGAPTITKIDLETEGKVDGIDEEQFAKYAEQSKKECVVSRALGGVDEMTVSAKLQS
jgi:osmotically inducible protein OsmC